VPDARSPANANILVDYGSGMDENCIGRQREPPSGASYERSRRCGPSHPTTGPRVKPVYSS
jgi:hypothetical protein